MAQQYYAVVFSGGFFGTLLIGDMTEVQRLTEACSNMHPVMTVKDGSRAIVLSMHSEYHVP